MKKFTFILAISFFLQPSPQPSSEKVSISSPEGWGMSYMSAASLNLSDSFPTPLPFGDYAFTGEISTIPKLNREQQKIGFGGLKYEDLNKSPLFGRGKLKIGFYWDSILELSYTPPLEIRGAKPKNLWGIALAKSIISNDSINLGVRYYHLAGHAVADVTCSKNTVNQPLYTAGNPSGCISVSKDRIDLGHQGFEMLLESSQLNANFRPYVSIASTEIDSSVKINAELELSREVAFVKTSGTINTLNLGLNYQFSDDWQINLGTSYTPLDVNRPSPAGGDDDFWNVKLGFSWNPR